VFVVRASARRMESILGVEVVRQPGYRRALIEAAVVTNAALAAHTLRRDMGDDDGAVDTAYGVYLLSQRSVWAPRCGSDEVASLARPPNDAGEFAGFSESVMRSQRIRTILVGD